MMLRMLRLFFSNNASFKSYSTIQLTFKFEIEKFSNKTRQENIQSYIIFENLNKDKHQ